MTILERQKSFEAICSDERFTTLRYAITDYLAVGDYEITDSATEEIAALHIGPVLTNPRILIAAVAVRPDIVAAIRAFIRLGFTDAQYRIFPSEVEARRWIAETVGS